MTHSKRKAITVAVITAAVAAALAVLCLLLFTHPEYFDFSPKAPSGENRIDLYNHFYEADFSKKLEDMENYETYLEYDRYVHYKDGPMTIGINDKNAESFGSDVMFFTEYFDIIISGRWEEYNKLFTEKYYETHDKKEQFTPQMLYDMEIEKLSVSENAGVNTCAYNVSYKIFENNGTFRDDIYSDASKTIYVEIDDSEGKYRISTVKYYVAE